jgi:hypothetical protein
MNDQIVDTAVESTTVAAETAGNAVSALMESDGAKYAAIATGVIVGGYCLYRGGKYAFGKVSGYLAKRKEAKAA